MAKVVILCGKIASGKTHYANILRERDKAIILSVDDLMLKLSDSCLGKQHNDIALRCESYFYGLAEQLISAGHNVVIDFGYWYRKEREEAKRYFSERGIEVEFHYIQTSEERRLAQLALRNSKLSEEMLQKPCKRVYIIDEELRARLDQKFEEPAHEEISYRVT